MRSPGINVSIEHTHHMFDTYQMFYARESWARARASATTPFLMSAGDEYSSGLWLYPVEQGPAPHLTTLPSLSAA